MADTMLAELPAPEASGAASAAATPGSVADVGVVAPPDAVTPCTAADTLPPAGALLAALAASAADVTAGAAPTAPPGAVAVALTVDPLPPVVPDEAACALEFDPFLPAELLPLTAGGLGAVPALKSLAPSASAPLFAAEFPPPLVEAAATTFAVAAPAAVAGVAGPAVLSAGAVAVSVDGELSDGSESLVADPAGSALALAATEDPATSLADPGFAVAFAGDPASGSLADASSAC
jgi:hypothetical protein